MHVIVWSIIALSVQLKLWNLPSCLGLLPKALHRFSMSCLKNINMKFQQNAVEPYPQDGSRK